MKAELKPLYDEKGKAWAAMNEIARKLKENKDYVLTPEEDAQFEKADADLKAVSAKIEKIERTDKLAAELEAGKLPGQPGNGGKTDTSGVGYVERGKIYQRAMLKGSESLNTQEKAVFEEMQKENAVFSKILCGGELSEDENKIARGMRAQSTTTTAGGYTIPQGFIAKIDAKLKYISPFFAEGGQGITGEAEKIFDVIRTATGNALPFPTNDDTGNVGELLAENTDAFTNATDLTFGQITLNAYKYNAKPFKVSNELLTDTGVDLESYILNALVTRVARIANTHLTTGDNSGKPQGIVAGASAGKTTAGASAITFPEVLDLIHSVDPAYRMSPSARFMFHDNVLLYLKKLTIGSATNDGRPLWQPGYQVGAPDTIDGFKYLINQDMASSVATTNKTMLFGDMKKYMVRLVSNYIVKRLDERFADADQTAWLLFMRMDGRYANTSAIKYMLQA